MPITGLSEVNLVDYQNEVYNAISYNWMDSDDIDVVDEPAKHRRTLAMACFFLYYVYSTSLISAQDNPLHFWENDIDLYLSELLRLEGPREIPLCCTSCSTDHSSIINSDPLYRCLDCTDRHFWCQLCVVRNHYRTPFHRIEVSIDFIVILQEIQL